MNFRFAAFLLVIAARSIYFTQHYVTNIDSNFIERFSSFFIPVLTLFVHLLLLRIFPVFVYWVLSVIDFVVELGIATYHDHFIENIDVHTIFGASSEGLQVTSFILVLIPKLYLIGGSILLIVQCIAALEAKKRISSKLLLGSSVLVLPLLAFAIYKVPIWKAKSVADYSACIKLHGYYTAIISDFLATGPISYEEELLIEQLTVEPGWRHNLVLKNASYEADLIAHLKRFQARNPVAKVNLQIAKDEAYQNLLVIQVESLDYNLLGYEYREKPVTPFLNQLRENAILLKIYAFHVGASGSSGADFQFLSGMLPLHNFPVFKVLSIDYSQSLPVIFNSRGVHSFAFHGNSSSMWGRGTAYQKMGIARFYDPADFPRTDVSWGISDRLFFQQSKEIISKQQEGSHFNFLITLSSHGPFNFVNHQAYEGSDLATNYFNSMNYVDMSISQFFNNLPGSHLVIMYGDHTAALRTESYDSRENGKEYVPGLIFIINDGKIRRPATVSKNFGPAIADLDIRSLHHFARDHFPRDSGDRVIVSLQKKTKP